jgi:hypothetical protein
VKRRTHPAHAGEETALELVRQCFVNRPLSAAEHAKLSNLVQLSTSVPALPLLCHDLEISASQLAHLPFYNLAGSSNKHNTSPACSKGVFHNAATAYLHARQEGPCNPRRMLTLLEEEHVLGMRAPLYNPARPIFEPENVEVHADNKHAMKFGHEKLFKTIKLLATMTTGKGKGPSSPPSFPLVASAVPTNLETSMLDEQKASWDAHHSLEVRAMRSRFTDLSRSEIRVDRARARLEHYLLKVFSHSH